MPRAPKDVKKAKQPEPEPEPELEPEIEEEDEEDEDMEADLQEMNQLREETEKAKEELQALEEKGDKAAAADKLTEIADMMSRSSDFEGAVEILEKEVKLRLELNHADRTKLKAARLNLSALKQINGDHEGAEAIMLEQLSQARNSKDFQEEAECLSELATLYLAKYESVHNDKLAMEDEEAEPEDEEEEAELAEDLGKVISYGEAALKICYDKKTDQKLLESDVARRANHAMGEALMHLGDVEKALPHWDQVAELARKGEQEQEMLVETLCSVAKAYFGAAEAAAPAEGEEDTAEQKESRVKYGKKALALFEEGLGKVDEDNAELQVQCLSGFVSCYDVLEQPDKGIEAQKKILAIEEKQGDIEGQVEALVTLAEMEQEVERPIEAVKYYQKARELAAQTDLEELVAQLDDAITQLQSLHKDSLKGKKQKK